MRFKLELYIFIIFMIFWLDLLEYIDWIYWSIKKPLDFVILKWYLTFNQAITLKICFGQLYDLHIGIVGESSGTEDGCSSDGCGLDSCPSNSTCMGNPGGNPGVTCVCDVGLRGPDCDIGRWFYIHVPWPKHISLILRTCINSSCVQGRTLCFQSTHEWNITNL